MSTETEIENAPERAEFTDFNNGFRVIVRAPCGCVEGSCWRANVGELRRFLTEFDDARPIVIANEAGERLMPRRCDEHASRSA